MTSQTVNNRYIPSYETKNLLKMYNTYKKDKHKITKIDILQKIYFLLYEYVKPRISINNEYNVYIFENTYDTTTGKKSIQVHDEIELLYKIYTNNEYNIMEYFINSLRDIANDNVDLYQEMYKYIFLSKYYKITQESK